MFKLVKNESGNGAKVQKTTVREGVSASALRARAHQRNRDAKDGSWYTVESK